MGHRSARVGGARKGGHMFRRFRRLDRPLARHAPCRLRRRAADRAVPQQHAGAPQVSRPCLFRQAGAARHGRRTEDPGDGGREGDRASVEPGVPAGRRHAGHRARRPAAGHPQRRAGPAAGRRRARGAGGRACRADGRRAASAVRREPASSTSPTRSRSAEKRRARWRWRAARWDGTALTEVQDIFVAEPAPAAPRASPSVATARST